MKVLASVIIQELIKTFFGRILPREHGECYQRAELWVCSSELEDFWASGEVVFSLS